MAKHRVFFFILHTVGVARPEHSAGGSWYQFDRSHLGNSLHSPRVCSRYGVRVMSARVCVCDVCMFVYRCVLVCVFFRVFGLFLCFVLDSLFLFLSLFIPCVSVGRLGPRARTRRCFRFGCWSKARSQRGWWDCTHGDPSASGAAMNKQQGIACICHHCVRCITCLSHSSRHRLRF